MRFLTAQWRNLVMVNYLVEPSVLLPFVPVGTKLDLREGKCYLSLVAFMFERTRVLGVPIPFHINFEEINLRFYVKRLVGEEWRRGVVFVKEIVPRYAVAQVARILYQENYASAPMRHEILEDAQGMPRSLDYQWRHNKKWNRIKLETSGPWRSITPGSEEEFITEHYYGYTAWPNGKSVEYQVEHPKWRMAESSGTIVECDVASVYHSEFKSALSEKPVSSFLCEGSEIVVHQGVKIS